MPAGEYARLRHDVSKNHKLDHDRMVKPTEQWGLSNNSHAVIEMPSYCKFALKRDMEVYINMQQ